jgi:hypothetical protein
MRNCWSLSRYTILEMILLEKKGAIHSFFAEDAKHVHLWAVMNIFQRDTYIFAAPHRAVVGIDLATNMKCALITENYGVQKSLQQKSH